MQAELNNRTYSQTHDFTAMFERMWVLIDSFLLTFGWWNDTGVAMMNTRMHQCLCLAEPLPDQLHSLSLHVAADESAVHVHDGPVIPINGRFFEQEFVW